MYTKEQWLEIMPFHASKANAVRQLKALLGCEKIVAFGDGKNDIDLFELADEAYAVENAHEDLKKYATDIILYVDAGLSEAAASGINAGLSGTAASHVSPCSCPATRSGPG